MLLLSLSCCKFIIKLTYSITQKITVLLANTGTPCFASSIAPKSIDFSKPPRTSKAERKSKIRNYVFDNIYYLKNDSRTFTNTRKLSTIY